MTVQAYWVVVTRPKSYRNHLRNQMGSTQMLEYALGLQAYRAADVQHLAAEGACEHASGGRLVIHAVLTSSTSM